MQQSQYRTTFELNSESLDLTDLMFSSGLFRKGFYASGAIYYFRHELSDNEKLATGASHAMIPVDMYGQPLGYLRGDKETLDQIVEDSGLFKLTFNQANGLGTLNLQEISLQHYGMELSAIYGLVNSGEKDQQRRYKSNFPSLRDSQTVSLVDDLHAVNRAIRPKGKHIDVGCGRGKDVLRYLKDGYDSVGFDISETQVEGAHDVFETEGIDKNRVWQHDILNGVSDYEGKFDIVTCSHVYQHLNLNDAYVTTENAIKMLNDDGVMMLCLKMNTPDWKEYFANGVRIQAEDLSSGIFRLWDPDLDTWRPGYRLFLPEEVEGIIRGAGGRITQVPTFMGSKKGVIPHNSGRGFPTAAYYIEKAKKPMVVMPATKHI